MVINNTLGERVFERLKDEILTGNLKPGDKLRHEELAERFEVSLTPIKEAIHMLEQEGLAKLVPRKGAYVIRLTDRDILEFTQIRLALEGLAVDLVCEKDQEKEGLDVLKGINRDFKAAVERRDAGAGMHEDLRFHLGIVTLSGNKRLVDLMTRMPLANFWGHVGRQAIMIELGDAKVAEHDGIIAAIESREAQAAKGLLRRNILYPSIEGYSEPGNPAAVG